MVSLFSLLGSLGIIFFKHSIKRYRREFVVSSISIRLMIIHMPVAAMYNTAMEGNVIARIIATSAFREIVKDPVKIMYMK